MVTLMTNDAPADPGVPSSSPAPDLVGHSGFLDGMKKAFGTVRAKATDLVHQGVDKGRQIATAPQTRQIEGEALNAGKQIVEEHKQKGLAVVEAGKRGDVQGVLRNGLPLAGEMALKANPLGLLYTVGKDPALGIAMKHATPEQQAKLKGAATILDRASSVTHFNFKGIGSGSQLVRHVVDGEVHEQVASQKRGVVNQMIFDQGETNQAQSSTRGTGSGGTARMQVGQTRKDQTTSTNAQGDPQAAQLEAVQAAIRAMRASHSGVRTADNQPKQ